MDGKERISSKKKPFDVELIFSPPRRILARLTEAVSVKGGFAQCRLMLGDSQKYKEKKEDL